MALAAFVLALGAVELALRVYGALARAEVNRRLLAGADDGRPVIAFVGDSNVYGLYLERDEDTLPKQVEALAAKAGTPLRCVNFGIPAAASWAVVEQARRALELRPAAIVARCGINDTWQRPPGSGLGILEELKLVRFLRLLRYNTSARTAAPPLGAGGAAGEANQIALGSGRALLQVPPREGDAGSLEIAKAPSILDFAEFRERLRQDYEALVAMGRGRGPKVVFATYLAGQEGGYAPIREAMLAFGAPGGAAIADCAPQLARAVAGPESQPNEPPLELALARRALLLTRDRHPTALGYAVEARVVLATLASLGLARDPGGDPLAPLRDAPLVIPKIRRLERPPLSFEVHGAPGDRVTLVLGPPGRSTVKEVALPIDWKAFESATGIGVPAAPLATIPNEGSVVLRVPPPRRMPQGPVVAMAILERGGQFGAAQMLATAVTPVAFPPR